MDYNPNDKAQRRFVDSPVLADVVLSIVTIGLGVLTWACFTQASPQYVAGGIFGLLALLCAFGVLSAKRRTFTFDNAAQTMTWTSRGLGENRSGTVAFKDISISLDSTWNRGTEAYRVMIETPQGTWPLTTAYRGGLQRAQARAGELRSLIGQPTDAAAASTPAEATQTGEAAAGVKIKITRG
jgi:hypothetical protein